MLLKDKIAYILLNKYTVAQLYYIIYTCIGYNKLEMNTYWNWHSIPRSFTALKTINNYIYSFINYIIQIDIQERNRLLNKFSETSNISNYHIINKAQFIQSINELLNE